MAEFLETTVDKFTFKVAADRPSQDGQWSGDGFLRPTRRPRPRRGTDPGRRLRSGGQYLRDDDVHLGRRAIQIGFTELRVLHRGQKLIELDRTEIFTDLVFRPKIVVRANETDPERVLKQVNRALESAQKYSLVANSVKSKITIEPTIEVLP